MLKDVFLCRKHMSFMIGSLFLSGKSKGDLHFARKSWLTRMCFPNSWRFGVCSSVEPVQFPFTKTVAASSPPRRTPSNPSAVHRPPHHSHTWRRCISFCTVRLPPATIQESWITPCRLISQHEWQDKNVPWEVSGAEEPLFVTNPVKTTG